MTCTFNTGKGWVDWWIQGRSSNKDDESIEQSIFGLADDPSIT